MGSVILRVQGYSITVDKDGYVNITDIAKASNRDARPADVIKNWLSSKSTIEFLGTWEMINNANNFKVVEFHHFKERFNNKAFSMSIANWADETGAIGVFSRLGKTGGAYAHKDIAFEFCASISPAFKLYLIKEYQRLREIEQNIDNPEWNMRRLLSKSHYHIQTAAIKTHKIPSMCIPVYMHYAAYAEEADILNLAIFGTTAKEWRESHQDLARKGDNVRDYASIIELAVLSTIEAMNAEMIKSGIAFSERLERLKKIAKDHMDTLKKTNIEKSFRKSAAGKFAPFIKAPGDELAA